MYDGSEHTPKLLQCSHTVCLHCLTRIAASQTRDNGTFRCPICRELITIPRGGVAALPPSFLVNQLLDLMSRQRREVIPKCSVHLNQELLFCETCDTVFCNLCTVPGHHGQNGPQTPSGEHTIIPFSIAIKRMSEILLYKANECISKVSIFFLLWVWGSKIVTFVLFNVFLIVDRITSKTIKNCFGSFLVQIFICLIDAPQSNNPADNEELTLLNFF